MNFMTLLSLKCLHTGLASLTDGLSVNPVCFHSQFSLIPVLFLCLLVSSLVSVVYANEWIRCPLFLKWITFEILLFSCVSYILWDSLSFLFPTVFGIERSRREEADMNDEWSFPSPELLLLDFCWIFSLFLSLLLPQLTWTSSSRPYIEPSRTFSCLYISPHLKQQVLQVIRT